MIDLTQSIIIDRPLAEVFAFVSDQTNGPRWQSGLLEVRRMTEGPLRVGTQNTAVRKFMGRRLEVTNEYTKFEQDTEYAFRSTSGPVKFEAAYVVESTAEGTKLTSRLAMHAAGLFGMAEPLIAASLRRELEANLGDLKDLLEAQPATAAVGASLAERW